MGWKWENPAPFACCAHHAGALSGAGRFTVSQLLSCSWPFLELHICLQEPESRACILRGGIALPKSSVLALSGAAHLPCCCKAPPRPAPDLLSFLCISNIRTEMQQSCHIAELGTRRNTAETDDQGNNLHNWECGQHTIYFICLMWSIVAGATFQGESLKPSSCCCYPCYLLKYFLIFKPVRLVSVLAG